MQQNGGVCFRFNSLLFTTSISMLGNLKLEKNFIQNKSLRIPEINLLKTERNNATVSRFLCEYLGQFFCHTW